MTGKDCIDDVRGEERIDTRDLVSLVDDITAREDAGDPVTDEERAFRIECDAIAQYCADFQYGEQMVAVNAFVDYAQELAEDIGAINVDASWPHTCIDWEQAARDLAMDYTIVTLLGHDYYVR